MLEKIKQWFGTAIAFLVFVLGFLLVRQEKKTEELEGVLAKEKQDAAINQTLEKDNEATKTADDAESDYRAYINQHLDDKPS